jgi:subfamily B ATP-binding cassette protein MsbA
MKKDFLRILKLYLNFKVNILISFFCMIIVAACVGFHAWLVQPALDKVLIEKNIFYLYFVPSAIILTGIVKGIASYFQIISLQIIGNKVIADLRKQMFSKLINLDLIYYIRNKIGVTISRISTDTLFLNNSMTLIYSSLIKDSLTIIVLVGNMFYQNWQLAFLAIIFFPLSFIPIAILGKRIRNLTRNLQSQLGAIIGSLEEVFKNIKIVKSYSAEQYEISKTYKEIDKAREINLKQEKTISKSRPFTELLGALLAGVIIFGGGIFVIKEGMTSGQLMSFLASLMLAYAPLKRLINVNIQMQSGLSAANRIFEIIDSKILIRDGNEKLPIIKRININNLKFRYENSKILSLDDVTLNIELGKKIAFVGSSGAGKSTLLSLIIRLFDIEDGEILINGKNIKQYKLRDIRNQITFVPQETLLFDGSIKENIRYNSKISDSEIKKIIRLCMLEDFIYSLPEKINTKIGEGGVKISGGQRQRIGIARALAKKNNFLFLDEPTSNLDLKTESSIFNNLNSIKNLTIVVVAHRLDTIKNFDKIYLFEKGKIIEKGVHKELMKRKKSYYNLYMSQNKSNVKKTIKK